MKYLFSLFSIYLSVYSLSGQITDQEIRLAFYNVENLFHPEIDTLSEEDEYSPEGNRHWNSYRYSQKVNQLAKVIVALGKWKVVDIMGLAEVENEQVLIDLTKSTVLKKSDYSYIHYSSPDRRGIDVALLYRKAKLKLLASKKIPVQDSLDIAFHTRDMLLAKFHTLTKDTIHVFICHWPSRYGGQAQSEPKRLLASSILSASIDSIAAFSPNSKIIVAGDFNDEPHNPSLMNLMNNGHRLVNLMENLDPNKGSHKYQGTWSYLDQFIVSQSILSKNSNVQLRGPAMVFTHPMLMEKDEKYFGLKPFRTYLGFKYQGGFSDHLPVYIDLFINKAVD